MTDDDFDEADFDDPAHTQVRDLLASARVAIPVPAEVVARLDATLAELTGQASEVEPLADDADPVVVPLRRRARLAPRLLAAAAVVLVAGAGAVGLNQILNNGGSAHTVSADSATADAVHGQNQPEAASPLPGTTGGGALLNGVSGSRDEGTLAMIPTLTTADFAHETATPGLRRALLFSRAAPAAQPPTYSASRPTPTTSSGSGSADSLGSNPPLASGPEPKDGLALQDLSVRAAAKQARNCVGPKIDGTSQAAILLDGRPAVLVVHPANAGTKLVEAWSCDGSRVLAFTTVPA